MSFTKQYQISYNTHCYDSSKNTVQLSIGSEYGRDILFLNKYELEKLIKELEELSKRFR